MLTYAIASKNQIKNIKGIPVDLFCFESEYGMNWGS